ncbi:MAG: hypothetical protein MK097_16755 [Dechloromonas sp.]|nr:hypothetical protein [Dechloromonas sp.]
MSWLVDHWGELLAGAGAILAAASLITRLTPTPKDDAAVSRLQNLLARISMLNPPRRDRRLKMPGKAPEPPTHPDDLR